jgi:hypothetical protein
VLSVAVGCRTRQEAHEAVDRLSRPVPETLWAELDA